MEEGDRNCCLRFCISLLTIPVQTKVPHDAVAVPAAAVAASPVPPAAPRHRHCFVSAPPIYRAQTAPLLLAPFLRAGPPFGNVRCRCCCPRPPPMPTAAPSLAADSLVQASAHYRCSLWLLPMLPLLIGTRGAPFWPMRLPSDALTEKQTTCQNRAGISLARPYAMAALTMSTKGCGRSSDQGLPASLLSLAV